MRDGLDAARALLPGLRLDAAEELGGSDRSTVHRTRATDADGAVSSLIVKQYPDAGQGWLREASALAVVPETAMAAPRLVAASREPPVVVTADLGSGPSVADALLGRDPVAAADAVAAWAEAIAGLHTITHGARAVFRGALDERQGDLAADESRTAIVLDDAVRVLDRECGSLGVTIPSGALEELRGLASRLGPDGAAALTPGDTCPDNNVRSDDRLTLIDFEDAQWRHVAWDVAYLRVPWPTCWCSWRIPDEVAARGLAAYRRVASEAIPDVAGLGFEADVEAAALGWALISTTRSLDYALDDDPPVESPRPIPTRRARILHRLAGAAACTELPALAELAGALRASLHRRWGEIDLALAPAFRTPQ